jgi:hypothetical protein
MGVLDHGIGRFSPALRPAAAWGLEEHQGVQGADSHHRSPVGRAPKNEGAPSPCISNTSRLNGESRPQMEET